MYFPRVLSCALICGLSLGGCGLSNPKISEIWNTGYPEVPADTKLHKTAEPPLLPTTLIEFEIKKRIYCELKDAVHESLKYPIDHRNTPTGPITYSEPLIPPSWTAQIQISLQLDESSPLNPGLTLNEICPNAIKTFAVGNTFTAPH